MEIEVLGHTSQVQKAEVGWDVPRVMLRRLRGHVSGTSPLFEQQGEGFCCLRIQCSGIAWKQ